MSLLPIPILWAPRIGVMYLSQQQQHTKTLDQKNHRVIVVSCHKLKPLVDHPSEWEKSSKLKAHPFLLTSSIWWNQIIWVVFLSINPHQGGATSVWFSLRHSLPPVVVKPDTNPKWKRFVVIEKLHPGFQRAYRETNSCEPTSHRSSHFSSIHRVFSRRETTQGRGIITPSPRSITKKISTQILKR